MFERYLQFVAEVLKEFPDESKNISFQWNSEDLIFMAVVPDYLLIFHQSSNNPDLKYWQIKSKQFEGIGSTLVSARQNFIEKMLTV